jgi:NPCBM/NEW2 domain
MIAVGKARWRNQVSIAVLLVYFTLVTAACSTTNNNGNCDAQGASNGVTCIGPTSTPASSPPTAGSSSTAPPSSSAPSSSPSSPAEVGYYLADFNTVQTYGINVDSTPRQVNGVMYDHPVAWAASPGADDPWWAEWDLARNCTWLTSPGVGISDEAPSGSRYVFYVLTDGSYKWQKTVSLGHPDAVRVSIKGALRLRLSAAAVQNAYGGPYATWGDAKIWCSSEPPGRKN